MNSLILSIETATLAGSVAVSSGRDLILSRAGDSQLSHSNTLLSDIDRLLADAGLSLAQIGLFAAAIGPGSFTGLRIGIATVKGLAATLVRPCVGVPTLHAVALAAGPSEGTVSVLPAGRGEVFAQLLKVTPGEIVIELDQAAHISPQKMLERYSTVQNACWAGEGARVYAETIREFAGKIGRPMSTAKTAGNGWRMADRNQNLAEKVAALAALKAELGNVMAADALQALYVRPSDAELNPKFSVNHK